MSEHPVEKLYGRCTVGPFAVARVCTLCKWHDTRRRGGGRGAGFREGNKQRGRLIQHIKAAHPAEYAAAMTTGRAERAERVRQRIMREAGR